MSRAWYSKRSTRPSLSLRLGNEVHSTYPTLYDPGHSCMTQAIVRRELQGVAQRPDQRHRPWTPASRTLEQRLGGTFNASVITLGTRTGGSCSPRTTSLRHGFGDLGQRGELSQHAETSRQVDGLSLPSAFRCPHRHKSGRGIGLSCLSVITTSANCRAESNWALNRSEAGTIQTALTQAWAASTKAGWP